jgi:hypothetical protein
VTLQDQGMPQEFVRKSFDETWTASGVGQACNCIMRPIDAPLINDKCCGMFRDSQQKKSGNDNAYEVAESSNCAIELWRVWYSILTQIIMIRKINDHPAEFHFLLGRDPRIRRSDNSERVSELQRKPWMMRRQGCPLMRCGGRKSKIDLNAWPNGSNSEKSDQNDVEHGYTMSCQKHNLEKS